MRVTGDKKHIDREEIKALYERGLSITEIAEQTRHDREYLRRIITDEMGLEPPKTKQKPNIKAGGGFSIDDIAAWSKEWDDVRFTVKMRLRTNFNKQKVMDSYLRRVKEIENRRCNESNPAG